MISEDAAYELDGCLVVREGAARLRWERVDALRWRLAGRWPNEPESDQVRAWIEQGRPVLVILGEPQSVPVLSEEWDGGPEDGDGEVFDMAVPALDWLAEPLRRRGLAFLDHSTRTLAGSPRLLLPALLLDEAHGEPVRFARRTSEQVLWRRLLQETVSLLFADRVMAGDGYRSTGSIK